MLIHGRFDKGFGWIAEPTHYMERSSTALALDGKVWLIDPEKTPGIEEEFEALGKPTAIISTVGWHDRDVDWYAARYGIPVYGARWQRNVLFRTPLTRVTREVPDSPFQLIDTSMRGVFRWWSEAALWWPEEEVLVTGDCVGAAVYFAAEGEKLGVHPISRFASPHTLNGLAPRLVYCGHGQSVQHDATHALRYALDAARAKPLTSWVGALQRLWRRARS